MDEQEYMQHRLTLTPGEAVLWRGKPKKSAYIATKSLTLMPIAILWLCVDSFVILNAFSGDAPWFIIPFMIVHLTPVWIWLASLLTANRRWKNTNYYVTNRRIIIQSGFLAVNETTLFYKDLHNAQVRIGLLDKIFHTGDIVFDNGMYYGNGRNRQEPHALEDLEEPYAVYERIQKVILDIQADMEYPNAFRPAENPGYGTNYRP